MTQSKFIRSIPLAAALALSVWGTAALSEMTPYQQLEQQVINGLNGIGVNPAGIGMLTMEEVAGLSLILDRKDSDEDKARAAKELMAHAASDSDRLRVNAGIIQLEEQLMAHFDDAGLSVPAGVVLSPSQIIRLSVIFDGKDKDADKKVAAELVFAESTADVVPFGESGMMQLEEELIGELNSVGIEKPPFGTLSLSQVAVLNSIFSSGDSNDDKKAAAMVVLEGN